MSFPKGARGTFNSYACLLIPHITRHGGSLDRLHCKFTQPLHFQRSFIANGKIPQSRRISQFANEDKLEEIDIKRKSRPAWQIQKESLKAKFGDAGWNPRKKLSPDTLEGIRHLHKSQPHKFTTPVLAQHFKVSPEAVRRILRSKWVPSDAEFEARIERWDKRGERIWTNLVELGVKPPKRWRSMGVGKSPNGGIPAWKDGPRNRVRVNDHTSPDISKPVPTDDIIPTVTGREKPRQIPVKSLSKRV